MTDCSVVTARLKVGGKQEAEAFSAAPENLSRVEWKSLRGVSSVKWRK